MKKVNLDQEYEKFKKNLNFYYSWKGIDISLDNDFIEQSWRDYQEENNLIDESNEVN